MLECINRTWQHVKVVMWLVVRKVLPQPGIERSIEALNHGRFHIDPWSEMNNWSGHLGAKKTLHLISQNIPSVILLY